MQAFLHDSSLQHGKKEQLGNGIDERGLAKAYEMFRNNGLWVVSYELDRMVE